MDIISRFRLDEFKTFFRVSCTSLQSLQKWIASMCAEKNITGITDQEGTGGSTQKPLGECLLMLLWFMAGLDKYSSLADCFWHGREHSSCAVQNLLKFINEYLLEKVVVWPTADEQAEIKSMYEELKNFPGVIGMIDGSHITIHQLSEWGMDYYNRKDYYSVVLQAVVQEDVLYKRIHSVARQGAQCPGFPPFTNVRKWYGTLR